MGEWKPFCLFKLFYGIQWERGVKHPGETALSAHFHRDAGEAPLTHEGVSRLVAAWSIRTPGCSPSPAWQIRALSTPFGGRHSRSSCCIWGLCTQGVWCRWHLLLCMCTYWLYATSVTWERVNKQAKVARPNSDLEPVTKNPSLDLWVLVKRSCFPIKVKTHSHPSFPNKS